VTTKTEDGVDADDDNGNEKSCTW